MDPVGTVLEVTSGPAVRTTAVRPAPLEQQDETSLVASVRAELVDYYKLLQRFGALQPDEVLLQVSSITARLVYLRALLISTGAQRANRLRSQELEPLTENLDLQFRIHSRLFAMKQLEVEMVRGQV